MNNLDYISAISFFIAVLNHYASIVANERLIELARVFYSVSAMTFIISFIFHYEIVKP